MGLLSGSKKVASQIFNFRVQDWFGSKNHQFNIQYLYTTAKNIFTSTTSENQETFEEAIARLNITEEDLKSRKQEFSRLFIIFLAMGCILFLYTMVITVKYKNFFGFILGMSVTLLSLAQSFKYHFWLTQIVKRKLGLTLKDWLNL
jgi:intracellular multiplication protein IcmV